jgi:DNA-binding NtrC family response regulator
MGTRTFLVHSDKERNQEQETHGPASERAYLRRPEEAEQTHVRRSDTEAPPASKQAVGRVLIVDDHAELRRVWTRVLARVGHEITEATSGADALRLLADRTFDIVLSDIQMPDMSGLELLARIRALDPHLTVNMLTGAPEAATVAKAQELGAFEYLSKPVDLGRLTASVGRGVARTHKRRA